MNSIARWRYSKYESSVPGSGEAAKSSKGVKNLTVEVTSFEGCFECLVFDLVEADFVAHDRLPVSSGSS